jgi:hypothetical protein
MSQPQLSSAAAQHPPSSASAAVAGAAGAPGGEACGIAHGSCCYCLAGAGSSMGFTQTQQLG